MRPGTALRLDDRGYTPAVVAIVGGVLLVLLGRALRAVDDHLADFN